LQVDDHTRLERALEREGRQYEPNYSEICRRFLEDTKDFSTGNVQACGITKTYDNTVLSMCVKEIKDDIYKLLRYGSGV
jgi:guanylate kinase